MAWNITGCGVITACTIDMAGAATSPSTAGSNYGIFGYSGVGLGISSTASGNNQGIGFFTCGDFERMRLTSTGYLGIGNTTPEYKLDLVCINAENQTDSIRLGVSNGPGGGGGTSLGGGLIWKVNYTGYTKRSAGIMQVAENNFFRAGLAFFTNGTGDATTDWSERMRISSTGNVGIGTTSPTPHNGCGALIIKGLGASRGIMELWDGTSGKSVFQNVGGDTYIGQLCKGSGNGDVFFLTGGTGTTATVSMTIKCAGNVGIGTTSPTIYGGGLEVARAGQAGVRVGSTGTNCGKVEIGGDDGQCRAYIQTAVPGGKLDFYTGNANVLAMSMLCNGNVGIGTSSPSTVLDIRGCNTDNAVTVRNFCGDSYSAIGYVNCQGTLKAALGIGNNSAAAPFANNAYVYTPASTDFLFYIAGAERMRVRCDGNVGIATTSPSYKLHVNGTFYAAGSSIKYKEGICQYDTDSCLFMCLKPVTYQYKDEWQHLGRELKSQSQIGLIAEDVAEVMPELAVLVNEDDEKVVRNVDYEKLSVVLLKEVQKLRLEVDQLKNNK